MIWSFWFRQNSGWIAIQIIFSSLLTFLPTTSWIWILFLSYLGLWAHTSNTRVDLNGQVQYTGLPTRGQTGHLSQARGRERAQNWCCSGDREREEENHQLFQGESGCPKVLGEIQPVCARYEAFLIKYSSGNLETQTLCGQHWWGSTQLWSNRSCCNRCVPKSNLVLFHLSNCFICCFIHWRNIYKYSCWPGCKINHFPHSQSDIPKMYF